MRLIANNISERDALEAMDGMQDVLLAFLRAGYQWGVQDSDEIRRAIASVEYADHGHTDTALIALSNALITIERHPEIFVSEEIEEARRYKDIVLAYRNWRFVVTNDPNCDEEEELAWPA